MILSHWLRRIILIVSVMEVAGGILQVTDRLSTNPVAKPVTQALGSLILLPGFYASTPLSARFFALRPSQDAVFQERLARIVATVPDSRLVFLYDHVDEEANTVGLLPSCSRIYMITGLLVNMSDEGMRGAIAYENTHAHERYTFAMFTYACCSAVSSHLLDNSNSFPAAFLLFLGTHQYYEYQADAGAAQPVGCETMLTVLCELAVLHPSKSWVRWFSFANTYPTLIMRIRAVETGRKALL